MTFMWPVMLWGGLLPVVLALLYGLAQRRRQAYRLKYASLALLREAVGRGPGLKRHLPAAFFLAAITVLVLALARPVASIPLLAQQGVIMLTIDTSGSMRAEDIAPSRIEAAKAAAKAFVQKQGSAARIGVVSFAASASLVQVPTFDREAVLAAIDRLDLQRGTAIGSGILTALNAILESNGQKTVSMEPDSLSLDDSLAQNPPDGQDLAGAAIILLSDGQSNMGYPPLDVVDRIAKRGLRIYTIGLGSVDGTVLNYYNRSARVSLDEDTLQQIAQKTGGLYFRAGSDTDLRQIYEGLGSKLVLRTEKTEIAAVLAGLGILLLLWSALLSVRWFSRLP